MSSRLLISARPGETLGAVIEGGHMTWFDFIRTLHDDRISLPVGSVVLGRVRKVEAGLQAAFVDLGTGEAALLSAKDARPPGNAEAARLPIEKLVHDGAAIVVQISRPGRKDKGPRVTADPTLPGPGRTTVRPLRGETTPLWGEIRERAASARAPALLWQPPEPDPAVRLWQEAPAGFGSIEVDHEPSAAALRNALKSADAAGEIRVSAEDVFAANELNEAIHALTSRTVGLKGGGSLIVESTAALTAIDVNAGGALGSTAEDTALKLNRAAAREIPYQLVLRRLGGIVVIDFLRLRAARHRREIVSALKQGLQARGLDVPVSGFSAAGLVELVLPHSGVPLRERLTSPCPLCAGEGTVPDISVPALALLAWLAREARHGGMPGLEARAAPDVLTWLNGHGERLTRELERFAVTAVSWKPEPHWPPERIDVRSASRRGR